MSAKQRLTMLAIAAAIAVAAVVVIGGGDDGGSETETAATEAATPTTTGEEASPPSATATATPTPTPRPRPPLLVAGRERELAVNTGETVRFRVRHPEAEEVHVHGYDISRDLQPGRTATISFKATLEGIFEIELEHSGVPIGSLKVSP